MSRKIIFTYLVVYQDVTLISASDTKTSIFEGTFAQVYKLAKSFCPEGYIIRDIRIV